ncbi:SDR family NAD(P)-dependent oxidoreductase [Cognatishimia maritima]|uniref:3-oxoacyl-[acyl-carrier protein] reductase n=1 Tax=Cognatishimia maritima TaxID=870908 RepID=A0A1M5QK33_9RHOB|nr:SDR family oxidoreductase [Cognatishimia maritima]SHH14455.1 3-oxoacyl-[acyl-carrier protein] reductase [Cognatishimia maritima]
MTTTLQGRTIIVTGAGSGIGLGVLKAVLAEGAVAVGIDYSDKAEATIREAGGLPFITDVRDAEAFAGAIKQARAETGRLDGMVNNAGLTLTAPFLDAEIEMWDQLWLTNQRSVLVGCQTAARIMVDDGRPGSLVNVASVHATASDLSYEGYAGTKGAIRAMGASMAWSLGPHRIRVNTLSPGLTMTEHVARVAEDPDTAKLFQSWHTDGAVPEVAEVAQAAVFLLSDASAALTGTEIVADKGTLARVCNVGV